MAKRSAMKRIGGKSWKPSLEMGKLSAQTTMTVRASRTSRGFMCLCRDAAVLRGARASSLALARRAAQRLLRDAHGQRRVVATRKNDRGGEECGGAGEGRSDRGVVTNDVAISGDAASGVAPAADRAMLLDIADLHVHFVTSRGSVRAVEG